MIERHFDIPFIANLALREKQIQQNYRPIIAVHKWFARRPGTLFRGLLLAEFADIPLKESFYQPQNFSDIHVADPFMGGGTPLLEANRSGCATTGYDINPMAYWIVRQEIEHLSLDGYREAARRLREQLEAEIGHLYRTRCTHCDSPTASVKYFLWIKTQNCHACGEDIDLFPGYLVAKNQRHPKFVITCAGCGDLNEAEDSKHPGSCQSCQQPLSLEGPAKRGKCPCPQCIVQQAPFVRPKPVSGHWYSHQLCSLRLMREL